MAAITVPIEVLERGAPPLCVKTGAPAETGFEQRFTYTPPGVLILFLFGILPGIIGSMVATREVTLELPATDEVVRRQWRNYWLFVISAAIGIITMLVAFAGPAWTWYRDASWVVFPPAFLVAIAALIGRFRSSIKGELSRDLRTVTLRRVHPRFATAVEPSAGNSSTQNGIGFIVPGVIAAFFLLVAIVWFFNLYRAG